MPTVAFLFPGQGSQTPGMGAELLTDPEIIELCERCSASAGVDLRRLLVGADDDELRLTQNAQPALCFMGLALTMLLKRREIEPAAAAGHSIGEYAALAAGGAVGAPRVIKAVVDRGRAMAEAIPAGTSSMSAVLGLDSQAVEVALAGMNDAWPANYNTPTQTVIAGTTAGLEVAGRRLQAAGAKRVVPLNVSAAFHTPLMAPAAERLRAALDKIDWRTPRLPVMANLTGRPQPAQWELRPLFRRLPSKVKGPVVIVAVCRHRRSCHRHTTRECRQTAPDSCPSAAWGCSLASARVNPDMET